MDKPTLAPGEQWAVTEILSRAVTPATLPTLGTQPNPNRGTAIAIYTTFFLCRWEDLVDAFPGWRPPLPQPVRREFKNPFTGEVSIIETREPEFINEGDEAPERHYSVTAIEGSYEEYLESRLPPFVRAHPHWAAKGLTEIELSPLAAALGVEPNLECALYGPPSIGALVLQLSPDMLSKLSELDRRGVETVAKRWATMRSSPEYTHSVTGVKLSDGWKASDAMELLLPAVALARQAAGEKQMYLLIEA